MTAINDMRRQETLNQAERQLREAKSRYEDALDILRYVSEELRHEKNKWDEAEPTISEVVVTLHQVHDATKEAFDLLEERVYQGKTESNQPADKVIGTQQKLYWIEIDYRIYESASKALIHALSSIHSGEDTKVGDKIHDIAMAAEAPYRIVCR